jgi:hypothetical protein
VLPWTSFSVKGAVTDICLVNERNRADEEAFSC